MSESPDSSTPPPEPPREPVNLRRHLFFGLAMVLAFGSMYTGLFGGAQWLQYTLAGAALIAVFLALASSPTKRP